ncbi:L-histidine N(alpha)-methyltransferase [Bacteroidota bacterium]
MKLDRSKVEHHSYDEKVINERLRIFYLEHFEEKSTFVEDVMTGLLAANKYLLPKYFYDARGSELFERICETEEYYLTRTELSIIKKNADYISSSNLNKNMLIELGSGSSYKSKYILESFLKYRDKVKYVPIDVSDIIVESSQKLIEKYSNLYITGLVSFYEEGVDFITQLDESPKMILFLGSSIGNFTFDAEELFLKRLRDDMRKDDIILIGFDMIKDEKVLLNAYNDREGITSEFNLNILRRINEGLGGNFDLKMFKHEAIFNKDESRIEMRLVSKEAQEVYIKAIDETIVFKEGETIHTENSHKFSDGKIENIANRANLFVSEKIKDEKNYFSLCIFKSK